MSDYSFLTRAQRVYDALLARLVAEFKTQGLPKIERRYLTVGDIDFPTRCSQFAVSARQAYQGKPAQQSPGPIVPHAGYQPYALELGVAYSRCWPLPLDSTLLPPGDETKAGAQTMHETDVVVAQTIDAYYAGELVDDCKDASIGPFVMFGPEGGVVGISVLITIQLS